MPLEEVNLQKEPKVAKVMVDALRRHGVDVIFGQSLPSTLHLSAGDAGIRQINYRTENAGGVMADGYARISRKVGVVTAQNGPAATLLVPPLAEAFKVSVPVVALVQDVVTSTVDKNAFQEFDHIALFQSCTKWVRRIDRADRVEDYVDMAMATACSGRPGPVALMCPPDVLNAASKAISQRSASLGHFPLDRTAADPSRVAEAADLLAAAKAPIIVAGGGVHLSDASAELAALQDAASIPVATTNMGKGAVSELHPLSLGVMANATGTHGSTRHMKPLLQDADVVLLVGNKTNQNGTDSWKLYPRGAKFIHIDVDSQEIGRNYEALRLVGDAKLTLAALNDALASRDLSARQANRDAVAAAISAGRAAFLDEAKPVMHADSSPIRPERVMTELDKVIDETAIVVADASYSSVWITNYLTARKPGQRFITPRGLAGLGWGLPLAMGAKVAAPDSPVICLSGDGGFGHCWQEMETAARLGINVVHILLNNGILGYQKHAEDLLYGRHTSAVHFAPVDHAAIARATGCNGVQVSDPDDIMPALKTALAADKSTLIEVMTDSTAHPPITLFG